VAIVPADAGGGTNALLLYPPDVIAPSFGPDSFAAHLRAAEAAGAAVQVVSDPALGFDLDTPDDLERLDPTRLRELTELGRAAADGVGV
jgi:2-phospho-L-lactate guanylyltransferase